MTQIKVKKKLIVVYNTVKCGIDAIFDNYMFKNYK